MALLGYIYIYVVPDLRALQNLRTALANPTFHKFTHPRGSILAFLSFFFEKLHFLGQKTVNK